MKSFDDGKYPILLEKSISWKLWSIISYSDGKIYNWGWLVLWNDKPIDFIIQNGEIKFGRSHSFISDWRNVDYAWEIITDVNGNILKWQNGSGHYKPDTDDLIWKQKAFNLLQEFSWSTIFNNLFKNK